MKRLPDPLVLCLDECIGKSVHAALASDGKVVKWSATEFGKGVPDEELLWEVGRRGWVFLTRDDQLRYRDGVRYFISRHKVAVFILKSKGITNAQQIEILRAVYKRITSLSRHEPRPFIARITGARVVKVIMKANDESGWNVSPARAPERVNELETPAGCI